MAIHSGIEKMSRLIVLSEQILLRLLSFSLAFCVSLIVFLPALNIPEEAKLRQLDVEIYKRSLNEKCERPNPLLLLVRVDKERQIKLNLESFGSLDNTSDLENKLIEVLKERDMVVTIDENHELEKSVIIRPDKTIEFEEVVKLIDVLNKIGANVIIDSYDEYSYCMGSHCVCNRFLSVNH